MSDSNLGGSSLAVDMEVSGTDVDRVVIHRIVPAEPIGGKATREYSDIFDPIKSVI
jgi:hypothetical protein